MRWHPGTDRVARAEAPPHLIRIDIDPEEMQRFPPHAGIVGDSAAVVAALLAALAQQGHAPVDNRAAIEKARREAAEKIRVVQPQMDYLDVIRAALPADGILVEELCQVGFASYFGYPVHQPRRYVSTGFQGTLGYGFPTALGVKARCPDKPVVSITGDGGLLFAVQELATARQYGIGLVTLVFNNEAYGNVRRDQQERFGNRLIGADLENPDFMGLASAFGVKGARVHSPAALAPVLAATLKANEPALIEIVTPRGSEASPWPFIHPAR
jgi:acetolactate synthase-1/2/3 large subunit